MNKLYRINDIVVERQTNLSEQVLDVVAAYEARSVRVVAQEHLAQLFGVRDTRRFDFVANLCIDSFQVTRSRIYKRNSLM